MTYCRGLAVLLPVVLLVAGVLPQAGRAAEYGWKPFCPNVPSGKAKCSIIQNADDLYLSLDPFEMTIFSKRVDARAAERPTSAYGVTFTVDGQPLGTLVEKADLFCKASRESGKSNYIFACTTSQQNVIVGVIKSFMAGKSARISVGADIGGGQAVKLADHGISLAGFNEAIKAMREQAAEMEERKRKKQ